MAFPAHSRWTQLAPPLQTEVCRKLFVVYARALERATFTNDDNEEQLEDIRESFVESVERLRNSDRLLLFAAGLVLTDLAIQGWGLRVRRAVVEVRAPAEVSDHTAEKERIRRQELVKRDAQLRQPAVQRFIRSMERTRVFNGTFSSIFSLMRDGRELSKALREARVHSNNGWASALAKIVDPYLQFVTSDEAICPIT